MNPYSLYYPHIAFHNPSPVKAMALYYDAIYRIVPDNVIPEDSSELAALLEDESIGRMIDPAYYAQETASEFLRNLPQWSAAALTSEENEKTTITKIHRDKTDENVRKLFEQSGFDAESDWFYVPTDLASNYMLYMAKAIASKNELSLVTGDWGAWTGTSYFSINGNFPELIQPVGAGPDLPEDEFSVFSLLLHELVPLNISEIPADKILQFREKRIHEIRNFRTCVSELYSELGKLESHDIRIDRIRDKAKALVIAQEDFKASADVIKAKGWFGVSMMAFPAPTILGNIVQLPSATAAALVTTGLAIGGLYNILSTKAELRKLRKDTPSSFLMELSSSFKNYTRQRGGGDMNFHAYNCMEEYIND